jgi:hypothetical protein
VGVVSVVFILNTGGLQDHSMYWRTEGEEEGKFLMQKQVGWEGLSLVLNNLTILWKIWSQMSDSYLSLPPSLAWSRWVTRTTTLTLCIPSPPSPPPFLLDCTLLSSVLLSHISWLSHESILTLNVRTGSG